MEEFTPLGAEMAQLAGRLGTLVPEVCERAQLEWIVASGRRLASFGAAQAALATVSLERLLRAEYAEALRGRPASGADTGGGAAGPSGDRDGQGAAGANDSAGTGGQGSGAEEDPAPGAGGSSGDGEGDAGNGAGAASRGGADDPSGRPESPEEFAQRLRQAKWLQRCPRFAEALQRGSISPGHVDVLGLAMEGVEPAVMADVLAEEDRLLEVARRVGRTGFGRYVRDVIDRVRADGGMARFERQLKNSFASFKPDDETQMYRLFCNIDPVRGAEMFDAVQRRVDEMYQTQGATDGLTKGQVVLQALHDLVCRQPTVATGDETADEIGGGPEILVICDCQTLSRGAHAHTICETYEGVPLPVSFVRDMCAEAMLTVAIAGADGQILAVGTAERLATRAQRRALRAEYRRCAHPGCQVPFAQCRIHHVVPWDRGGPTDLANLLPLCFKHHHLVHEGAWRLSIAADRTLEWRRPDGGLFARTEFVPLLLPAGQRASAARGSPSGAGTGPPGGGTGPPGRSGTPAAAGTGAPGPDGSRGAGEQRAAAGSTDLRLFDPSAA